MKYHLDSVPKGVNNEQMWQFEIDFIERNKNIFDEHNIGSPDKYLYFNRDTIGVYVYVLKWIFKLQEGVFDLIALIFKCQRLRLG